jgi:2'-hydroxyisoflavone reductase
LKLLVLGGTLFLGRHIVEAALARGHEVTLFNRGRTNPALFPAAEKLRGDRDAGDLEALRGRSWDAAIDTSGYVPRVVRASAEALAGRVGHYTFVSSLSVYMPSAKIGLGEDDAVHELEEEGSEDVDAHYGPLKVLCERAAEDVLPGRVLQLRSGLIVGPHDPTERFTYWVRRVARGGDVLAPAPPDARLQLIDVRDLAEWTIGSAEGGLTGTFNATGPVRTFAEMLDACRVAAEGDASFHWVDEETLLAREIDLPLWLPLRSAPEWTGFFAVSTEEAERHGLVTRSLAESARAILATDEAPGTKFGPAVPPTSLDPEVEAEILGTPA